MKNKKTFFFALLSLVFSQKASAFCESMATRVYIDMMPGNPTYITTRSRQDFMASSTQKISPNTLGLTLAKLTIQGRPDPIVDVVSENGFMCAGLKTIRFKMGYDTGAIQVFIDKKYPRHSCEYEVIKKHENYHVQVAQQAMKFFKPDVEKRIYDSIAQLRPKKVATVEEYQQEIERQYQKIIQDLKPLIQHINEVIAEKNYEIDTPESYRATTELCQNW